MDKRLLLIFAATVLWLPSCLEQAQMQTCLDGEVRCNGACISALDDANCGGCGITCAASQSCVSVADGTTFMCMCREGYATCGEDMCAVNIDNDPQNCGKCGHRCAGNSCVKGQCTCTSADPDTAIACDSNTSKVVCREGVETVVNCDAGLHCNATTLSCEAAEQTCESSMAPYCQNGQTVVSCVNSVMFYTKCPEDESCMSGACVPTACDPATTLPVCQGLQHVTSCIEGQLTVLACGDYQRCIKGVCVDPKPCDPATFIRSCTDAGEIHYCDPVSKLEVTTRCEAANGIAGSTCLSDGTNATCSYVDHQAIPYCYGDILHLPPFDLEATSIKNSMIDCRKSNRHCLEINGVANCYRQCTTSEVTKYNEVVCEQDFTPMMRWCVPHQNAHWMVEYTDVFLSLDDHLSVISGCLNSQTAKSCSKSPGEAEWTVSEETCAEGMVCAIVPDLDYGTCQKLDRSLRSQLNGSSIDGVFRLIYGQYIYQTLFPKDWVYYDFKLYPKCETAELNNVRCGRAEYGEGSENIYQCLVGSHGIPYWHPKTQVCDNDGKNLQTCVNSSLTSTPCSDEKVCFGNNSCVDALSENCTLGTYKCQSGSPYLCVENNGKYLWKRTSCDGDNYLICDDNATLSPIPCNTISPGSVCNSQGYCSLTEASLDKKQSCTPNNQIVHHKGDGLLLETCPDNTICVEDGFHAYCVTTCTEDQEGWSCSADQKLGKCKKFDNDVWGLATAANHIDFCIDELTYYGAQCVDQRPVPQNCLDNQYCLNSQCFDGIEVGLK